jgi:serine/threonine-protein kinase
MSQREMFIAGESRMGHFRVVGEVGQGGMGSVFIGLDEKLGRRVALKVIRQDQRLDPVRKARFLREARVLSSLDHPNICQFHDFIEGQKQDCIVLELVEGRNLREVMDEGIDEGLGMRIATQLLDVLVAVHGQGVIHRDLKPENIMLTREGNIKVLDFGLARPVEDPDSLSGEFHAVRMSADGGIPRVDGSGDGAELGVAAMTTFGTVLGTIGYMSPEVARGEPATAASDLYSVGSILQEIFTEEPPIPQDLPAPERHRRAMWAEVEPVTGLSAELTILIRRLQSLVPENRPTAIDAAEMLRSILDRPRRRRRRLLVAAVWAILGLFGVGMTVQFFRAEKETRRAEREAVTAREVSDFLVGLFEHGSPRVTRGQEISVSELLERGAAAIDESLEEQPAVRARMMHTLGMVYYHLGKMEEAGPLLEEALTIRREVLPPDDPELGASVREFGLLRRALGDYDEAERLLRESLRISKTVHGEDSVEAARGLIDLSGIDQDRGRWAAAEAPLLSAIAILEAHPDGIDYGLTDAIYEVASIYRKVGRLDEAEAALTRCLELDEAEFGPRSHQVAGDLAELSAVATIQGQGDKAERLARQSLEIRIEVDGKGHPYVGHSATTLGFALSRLDRFAEAEAAFQMALEVYRDSYGDDHPYVGSVLHSLGGIAAKQGDLDRSAELLQEAIEITAAAKGDDHPLVADSAQALASVRCDQGRTAEAMELFRSALAVLESTLGSDHPTTVDALEGYADCLYFAGLDVEAAEVETRITPRSD